MSKPPKQFSVPNTSSLKEIAEAAADCEN